MFKKILIANRGEIALRIIQACRELGIQTVAVYSTADRDSLHVTYADQDICIGPPPSNQSYLNISSILSAAEITGADAVHPGYGFLAENAHFAEVLAECKIGWIGPRPEVIRMMGDKANARQKAKDAGVPVLPGSEQPLADADEARALADEVGYPVILKASAGGGGRGMRIVHEAKEIASQFATAHAEAEKAFGDGSIYLEKYLVEPRHIEFQVFGDHYGTAIHLGERECSIQRRHQKLIEEAPSPALTPELRAEMGDAAVRLCQAVSYENAGTIEFLLDSDGSFYFMEMNTRIQVEHPVTEMVTGIDLVREQLRIAAGEPLGYAQRDVSWRGCAIECRINAEDPFAGWMPSPGTITGLRPATGPWVRDDSGVYEGYTVPRWYDTLVAKLIVWAEDRPSAIERMLRALAEYTVVGVRTTIPALARIVAHPDFRAGRLSTAFLERVLPDLRAHDSRFATIATIAAVLAEHERALGTDVAPAADDAGPSRWRLAARPGWSAP